MLGALLGTVDTKVGKTTTFPWRGLHSGSNFSTRLLAKMLAKQEAGLGDVQTTWLGRIFQSCSSNQMDGFTLLT